VVIRTGPLTHLVVLGAVGFLETGLVAALWGSVFGSGFTVDGDRVGVLGTLVLWLVLTPFVLLLGIAAVMLLRALARPSREVLTPVEYRREVRGRTVLRIAREEVTGLVFLPAAQATWQASHPDDTTTVRGVSRRRLKNRIEVRAPQATVELGDTTGWPEIVDILRGWVRERPGLVDDPVSIAFLRPGPRPATGDLPPTHAAGDRAEPSAPIPGNPIGLILLAIRRRDPWAPFLPDAYGQFSTMFNGRFTAPRAPRRGGTVGLLARWLFLACVMAPFVVIAWYVVKVAVLIALL
jgi:hypothetical protein